MYVTWSKDFFNAIAKDDLSRITKVPAFLAEKKGAEHYDATYREPNGGDYGMYGSAWLKWQLKNDKDAAKMFVGKNCGLCTDTKWIVQKKNIS